MAETTAPSVALLGRLAVEVLRKRAGIDYPDPRGRRSLWGDLDGPTGRTTGERVGDGARLPPALGSRGSAAPRGHRTGGTEDVEARRHEAATAALTCQWAELSFVRTNVRQARTVGYRDIGAS